MTSSQLATRNSTSDIAWSDEQKQLIKSTIAPGCTNDELRLFAYHCQRTGLDPFSKQIYAIKRGNKMTVQAGIDGLRAIAERTGELDGCQRFWCGEDGEWKEVWLAAGPPAAAKCVINRKGCSHPFVGVAPFRDYNAGQGLWTKMPSVMIGKVAEAQALRSGFPADLSGLYSSEEMDQADVRTLDVRPVEVATVQVVTPAPVPVPVPAPAVSVKPIEATPAISVAAEATPVPAPVATPVATPVAAPVAASPAAPLSAAERLAAIAQSLTATGRRALLKAYEPLLPDVKDIAGWLLACSEQAEVHLAGLGAAAIAALNEGRHPRTDVVLVNKPGRRPGTPADDAILGNDPEQPFAAA